MATSFFSEQDLDFEQVKCLTAGLFHLARVDGVHDREMTLLRRFYESCTRAGDPRFEDVLGESFDPAKAVTLFDTTPLRQMFIKTAVLMAFADGRYAQKEDAIVRDWARAFGLSDADVDALLEATKEFLLGSLAHVQNTDALQRVAKKLDLE